VAAVAASQKEFYMTRKELLGRLTEIRNAVHACNRNPVPNRARVEWRDMIDSLIADLEATPPRDPAA